MAGRNQQGSIYRRKDGRWCGAVSIPKTATRKARKKVLYGSSREEVEAKVTALHTVIDERGAGALESVGEYLDRWLHQDATMTLRPTTVDNYASTIRLHITPYIGHVALADLTTVAIQDFYQLLEEKGLGRRTRKNLHTVLHRSLRQAVDWGVLHENPCTNAKAPKVPRYRPRTVLDPEQTQRFLTEAAKNRLYALYVLAIASGARFGELAALEWKDVDWDNASITIRRSLANVRGRLAISDVKNPTSRRKVELPAFAMKVLREHQWRMQKEGWDASLIFVNKRGNPLRKENVHVTSFKPILERAGLPNIRFQDLRHTSSTLLFQKNVHPRIVQERLGHASIETTLNCYSHVLPTMQKEAAEKMDGILSAT